MSGRVGVEGCGALGLERQVDGGQTRLGRARPRRSDLVAGDDGRDRHARWDRLSLSDGGLELGRHRDEEQLTGVADQVAHLLRIGPCRRRDRELVRLVEANGGRDPDRRESVLDDRLRLVKDVHVHRLGCRMYQRPRPDDTVGRAGPEAGRRCWRSGCLDRQRGRHRPCDQEATDEPAARDRKHQADDHCNPSKYFHDSESTRPDTRESCEPACG